jgi:hypothetical protein
MKLFYHESNTSKYIDSLHNEVFTLYYIYIPVYEISSHLKQCITKYTWLHEQV